MLESKVNPVFQTSCFSGVDGNSSPSCNWIKNGKTKYGKQRFLCRLCKRSKVDAPKSLGYGDRYNSQIIQLTKEGLGIRSTARVLGISPATVLRKILQIAARIETPKTPVQLGRVQVDELHTFVRCKQKEVYVIYSWDQQNRRVLSLAIGTRSKFNLRSVVNPLLEADVESINTDRYSGYKGVVSKTKHTTFKRRNNHIERQNLTLRTHLKRLNRRTLCFSKSILLLEAVVKIYCWG